MAESRLRALKKISQDKRWREMSPSERVARAAWLTRDALALREAGAAELRRRSRRSRRAD